ncbi:RSC complex protein [Mycena maculata]|uniref:RSC complex protein n=1 Tax=Mycena maculata TaxID=230809 RepID=A0AAD7J2N2_9AGAR|nr:RSC complex protein [Mycena maculata]
MKRAHRQLNGGEAEASRAKRRKEMGVAGSSSDIDITSSDPVGLSEPGGRMAQVVDVRAQGLRLWQTVKDATNKEGRLIATDFLKKPSKKLYPDYYTFTEHPIALEDIKKTLDANVYPTLEAVRQDFELCFENAKKYNMKDSPIWKDAKDLLKLANKTYNKMVPPDEDIENATKKPSLHRLAKSRLTKLVEKTDDTGRILSTLFMELPSKKQWPSYYVQIKHPQCFDAIFKRLKRKDYLSSTEFADDVELVFSNAMDFNLEHTQIWEDALTLRDTFRQLMSDLPPPFTVPRYQKSSTAKIKIKMPAASTAAAAGPSSSPPSASVPPVVLRVPGATTAKASTPVQAPAPLPTPTPPPPKAASPALPPNTLPPNTLPSTNMIQVAHQPAVPAPTYVNTTTATFAHYPNASSYGLPVASPAPTPTPAPAPVQAPAPVPTPAKTMPVSHSNSPAPPPIHPAHMLKGVALTTEPAKRPFMLDCADGVKTWAMRLGPGERALSVADVTYMGNEEESSSEEDESEESEESDEDDDMDGEGPMKNGKRNVKGKGKGRGRGKKSAAATAAAKALHAARVARREARKIGEVQVKLNGFVVAEKADKPGQWLVDLQVGTNVLEVGEKGGLIWKVYAERLVV